MTEKLSTLEIRQRLGDILNRVALRNDQFLIERKGKPLAALIPVEKLRQIERLARSRLLNLLERQNDQALTQGQADALANEAKHRTRRSKAKSIKRK